MHVFSLLDSIKDTGHLPLPSDGAQAQALIADLILGCDALDPSLKSAITEICASPRGRGLLSAVFGNSPFLSRQALRDPAFLHQLMRDGPEQTMAAITAALAALALADSPQKELGRQLRILRGQAALTIAMADIAAVWGLDAVTHALSGFARSVLQCVIDALLRGHAKAGDLVLADPLQPAKDSGYVILAMGKLGAGELNYSSDIDLIVLFDPARCQYTGRHRVHDFFIRLTKTLVALLQDFTEDGYVFRVDLRLRPDPAATPIALSVDAAETYYESVGKGWERAAMIKARPIAGDIAAGDMFLKNIAPFVWRKNLDFAAVRDVYDMVGLIRAHHGHTEINVPGHNIKLGVGGIREIEFFAQTHQLIAGGRDRTLRDPTTLGVLAVLEENGQLDAAAASELRAAYIFLRTLEHRLQMIHDEQTQTLPKTAPGLQHLSCFMGFADSAAFVEAVALHLGKAAAQFQKLMGLSEADAGAATAAPQGDADQSLQHYGFADLERAGGIIEIWNSFRYRALRTQRARELLTQLMPAMLRALGSTSDPDAALLRFDEFLAAMPAGIQLLSLFNAHPWLLELIAEIMGTAPSLAVILARKPALLDAVLSPDFLESFPGASKLASDLDYALEPARDFQDVLDMSRRWADDRKFQVGVQLLRSLMDGGSAGEALSDLADSLIRALLPHVEAEFALKYGRIPGAQMAVFAMGKLGGRELTFTSDLDLVFIYPETDVLSDGKSPLSAAAYFARLSQRLINALAAQTAEGKLYEVDMRLRPSGGQGPIAVSLEAFRKYHRETAQTWEHMAWTRARLVSAPSALAAAVQESIRDFLARPRDPRALAQEVAIMRARIDREYHSDTIWNFKYVRGGMMDAEFITQFLLLRDAAIHPGVITGTTIAALVRLQAAGSLSTPVAEQLIVAVRLLRDMQQLARLCLEDKVEVKNAPGALQSLMVTLAGASCFAELEQRVKDAEQQIHGIYNDLVLGTAGLDADPVLPA